MNPEILFMIAGMTLVTYIPRALPAVFMDRLHFSGRMAQFLELIPCTVMAALIFPGILNSDPEHWYAGLAAGAVALGLAWKKVPLILCVLGAIGMNFLIYCFVF